LTEDSILGKGKRPDMDEDNEKLDEMSEKLCRAVGCKLDQPCAVQRRAASGGKDS